MANEETLGMKNHEKAFITIFQAPYASLVEHGLFMKMHDMDQAYQGVVPAEYYLPVFKGSIDLPPKAENKSNPQARIYNILEEAFSIFNIRHPSGYCGRSMSVGDIILLEGRYYLCAVVGFQPVEFKTTEEGMLPEKGKCCELTLPDGTVLQANVHQDAEYPCIGINMLSPNGEKTALCFAEYNPEKEPGHRLCIGVYCADEDDVVYYDSYCRSKSFVPDTAAEVVGNIHDNHKLSEVQHDD